MHVGPAPTPKQQPRHDFWPIQIAVWVAVWLFETFASIEFNRANDAEFTAHALALKETIPACIGFLLTSAFHGIYPKLATLKVHQLRIAIVLVCLIGAVIYSIVHFEVKYALGYNPTSSLLNWRNWLSHTPSRLVILAGWTAVYLAFVMRREALLERERSQLLHTAALRARANMLRYQVNPHFLFNVLNTISGHVLSNNPEKADSAITALSRFLRTSLDDQDVESFTLADELNRIESYLDVERTRFGDRLVTEITIDDGLETLLLPPLILQPLVENALKHGLSKHEGAGLLSITATRSGGAICVTVSNSTQPPNAKSPNNSPPVSFGLGLKNVEERLRLFFGESVSFTAAHRQPNRFEARFEILDQGGQ